MLGMTIADAIAFGSLCAALLAACAGLIKAGQTKREAPEEPVRVLIGPAAADGEALRDLAAAVADLAASIRAAAAVGQTRAPIIDVLHDLIEQMDHHH